MNRIPVRLFERPDHPRVTRPCEPAPPDEITHFFELI
jgi:hypothetical protein